MKQKMQKTEMSIFPMYFWAISFVILKGKIGKEDAIFEKSLFCEMFLEFDFTWKKCWFQTKIQNFILMTRPIVYAGRLVIADCSQLQLYLVHYLGLSDYRTGSQQYSRRPASPRCRSHQS